MMRSRWIHHKSISSMAKAIGQPCYKTHSHLLKPDEIMPFITRQELIQRRKTFASKLPTHSISIIPAYKTRYSTLNIFYPWQQNNNLLYLSGFDEPNAALVLEKDSTGREDWTLFIEDNDEHSLLWSGPRCSIEAAKNLFEIQNARPYSQLIEWMKDIDTNKQIFIDINENSCLDANILSRFTNVHKKNVNAILDDMRVTKSGMEHLAMQAATRIGADAFTETMKWAKSSRRESDLDAKMEFESRLRGANGLAYVPVVAGGDRANIIHYVRNDRVIQDDDLVLMDAGAKAHNYCSDITRTFPITGRFTEAQRELYSSVLRVQKQCIQAASQWEKFSSNMSLNVLNEIATYLFIEELGSLGFKRPDQAVSKLFPHSIGHYLGMDLHDCQSISYNRPLAPGMVITIEPGLYVPEHDDYPSKYHGVGIRIEDDILITLNGCTNLTEMVPRDPDEIESLMNKA